MVGKTTLSHQLRTRGEVQQINKRTVGLERASRKVIKFDGFSHIKKCRHWRRSDVLERMG